MEIKRFGFYFLFLIILLIALKFYTIVYDFFPSIASGCVLAYLFNPLYIYFHKRTKMKTLSAVVVIFIIIVLILIPVSLIILAVQKQIDMLFNEQTVVKVKDTLQNIDSLIYNKFNIQISDEYIIDQLPQFISALQEMITSLGSKMVFTLTRLTIFTFVSIFLTYYLLIHSKFVIDTFRNYFPLSYKNSEILLNELGKETKSLIFGQFLVASIQGTLGAIGLLMFGISGVILWGLIMTILSLIPVLGSFIIWFPVSIFLLVKGEYFNGIGLILWGSILVGSIDNILRPKITSSLGQIHPVTVLLGIFIGLREWGVIGLVIGPLIISILIILIKMFREEYLVE